MVSCLADGWRPTDHVGYSRKVHFHNTHSNRSTSQIAMGAGQVMQVASTGARACVMPWPIVYIGSSIHIVLGQANLATVVSVTQNKADRQNGRGKTVIRIRTCRILQLRPRLSVSSVMLDDCRSISSEHTGLLLPARQSTTVSALLVGLPRHALGWGGCDDKRGHAS